MASTIWSTLFFLNNLKIIIFKPPDLGGFFLKLNSNEAIADYVDFAKSLTMKYRQLTKEQFLELHHEFSKFLATQQIDAKEWVKIKKENTLMVEEELNLFSDVVWEDVLTKTEYLEHISEYDINLFKCNSKEIIRIYLKLNNPNKSFLNAEDFSWFLKNPLHDSIDYFKASKKYSQDRNSEIFKLIEIGSQISKGELFLMISQLI